MPWGICFDWPQTPGVRRKPVFKPQLRPCKTTPWPGAGCLKQSSHESSNLGFNPSSGISEIHQLPAPGWLPWASHCPYFITFNTVQQPRELRVFVTIQQKKLDLWEVQRIGHSHIKPSQTSFPNWLICALCWSRLSEGGRKIVFLQTPLPKFLSFPGTLKFLLLDC